MGHPCPCDLGGHMNVREEKEETGCRFCVGTYPDLRRYKVWRSRFVQGVTQIVISMFPSSYHSISLLLKAPLLIVCMLRGAGLLVAFASGYWIHHQSKKKKLSQAQTELSPRCLGCPETSTSPTSRRTVEVGMQKADYPSSRPHIFHQLPPCHMLTKLRNDLNE